MVFLLSRTNPFLLPILNCSIAITSFQISLTASVLLSNIPRLKFSIFPDPMVHSTLPLSTSLPLVVQHFVPKIRRDIWDSYSTINSRSTSTSIFTLTKLYRQSNAWGYLEIRLEALTHSKSVSSTDAALSPSPYMASSYGFTIKLRQRITWKSSTKCKEELLPGFWKLLKRLLLRASKCLQVSCQLGSTSKKSPKGCSYVPLNFLTTTYWKPFWTMIRPPPRRPTHIILGLSQIVKNL